MSHSSPDLPCSLHPSSRGAAPESEGRSQAKGRSSVFAGRGWAFWIAWAFFLACDTALCNTLRPFGLSGLQAAVVGIAMGLVVLLAELRLRRVALSGLVGGVFGTVLGIFTALLVTLIISRTAQPEPTKSFLEYATLFTFGYLGMIVGSDKGGKLRADALGGLFARETIAVPVQKLLDTSVLIDGRIAEICDAHFLDGVLGVPQFVLHELQMVADSSDPLKRQRGRRGLEVLQRMQKMPQAEVRILTDGFPQAGDVDQKLVELARRTGAKIVTNDFNLNKVATVQGLSVLNVNQLANALKTAMLPGEPMRVLISRDGKEANQGVAYLDDGTMVVVDGARRMINKSVDVIVTSVHQTTAGKMIFGRLEERVEQPAPALRQAAAAGRGDGNGGVRGGAAGRMETSPHVPEQPALDRPPSAIFPEQDEN